MNFLEGMIQGAANQATGILNQQIQDEAQLNKQQALAQFNADLDEKKMRVRLALEQEFRDAPIKRLGSKAQEFAGQDVPVDAPAPVTKVGGILASGAPIPGTDGKPIQIPEGTSDRGIVGDIAALRKQVEDDKSMSAEDRAGFLAQLEAQAAAENKANAESVAGKTRARTSDESMQSALDWAKVNDPVAYAEYQAKIGRSDRDERRIDNQEKRLAQSDATANRRLDTQEAYNRAHLEEVIRHNKEVENAALQRTGVEKLSPAAKVQLEIAGTSLASAQKEESIAAKAYGDAQRSMNPEAIESAKRDLDSARRGMKMAIDHYTQVGKAHLGMDWKDIEDPAPDKKAPPPDGTRGTVDGVVGTVINGKFVPDVKETRGKNTTKTRDPNIPTFSTFEKEMPASQAELVAAQNAVEEAKSRMESNRNAMTINAYNQAVTNLTALNQRGK